MPRQITQYRVFIASPGELDDERKRFREKLVGYSAREAEPRGALYHPVGWEDTIGGVGRPQDLINKDLEQCDYAVFVLHDRWGSPTGSGHTSGTEEEWALAEELYKDNKIRNIALFFKDVAPGQLKDPGKQLEKVLGFKKKIKGGKRYLFKEYAGLDTFAEILEGIFAKWLRDHEDPASGLSLGGLAMSQGLIPAAKKPQTTSADPGFDYWIAEAERLVKIDPPDHAASLFCASKARAAAKTDFEWARARNADGDAQFYLGQFAKASAAFEEIALRFSNSIGLDGRTWEADGLVKKGVALGALGRNEEAIAIFDDIVTRFGVASTLAQQLLVADALFNSGVVLATLGRSEEAISVCEDMVARFGAASDLPLREMVGKALFNGGVTLGELHRSDDAIKVYDDLLERFGTARELPLRQLVAGALLNKGATLGGLGRNEEAAKVYDDMLARFGTASELALREPVADALVNKGRALNALGRCEDAVKAYDDVLARFGTTSEVALRGWVADALLYKSVALDTLGRNKEARKVLDDLMEFLARFDIASEVAIREGFARGLFENCANLLALGRKAEVIAVCDDVVERFGSTSDPALQKIVNKARELKAAATTIIPNNSAKQSKALRKRKG